MRSLLKQIIPNLVLEKHRNYQNIKRLRPYIGNEVECVICGFHLKGFGPFGKPTRMAQCYNCLSLERHRLIWKYLRDKTDFFTSRAVKNILHFAPEKIFYDEFSRIKNINYVPCDLFPEKYNGSLATTIKKEDVTSISFAENTFDVIFCNHVLEHIPDDLLAMTELYRVLKPGGWAILQVPIDYNLEFTYEDFSITEPVEREKAFGQEDHVRWYGRDYKQRLQSSGFDVTEDPYVQTFSDKDIYKYGFMKDEMVYLCKKKNAIQ